MADESALVAKLESAELRFGLCDDEKLTKLLNPALVNILGFLASPAPAVRAKVMAILTHLNKRVKGNGEIRLPLGPLAAMFVAPGTAPLAANFALVYIEMGLPRIPPAERAAAVPPLLVGVAARVAAQQQTLFQLLLLVLPDLRLPATSAGAADALPFLTAPADRASVLSFLLDLILYLPPLARDAGSADGGVPAGLSAAGARRVRGKPDGPPLEGEALSRLKRAALRLLGAHPPGGEPLFAASETLPHYIVGASDSDGEVAHTSEAALRRHNQKAELDPPTIDALAAFVLGSSTAPAAAAGGGGGAVGVAPVASEERRRPASVAVRLRAIAQLARSVAAAGRFPSVLQAVFHAIFGDDVTPKLQVAGCQLALWVATHAPAPLLGAAAAHLHAGMRKVLSREAAPSLRPDAPEAVSMRSFAYGTVSALCKRAPSAVLSDESLPTELFRALETEEPGGRTNLHETLAALADVHANRQTPLPARLAAELRSLLLRSAADAAPHARLAAVSWASAVFAPDDLPSRYVCMLGTADERAEVRAAALKALRPSEDSAKKSPSAESTPGAGEGGFSKGRRVVHTGSDGSRRAGALAAYSRNLLATYVRKYSLTSRLTVGTIVSVHVDDPSHVYYTVRLSANSAKNQPAAERSTEASRLTPLAQGWPSFESAVAVVLRHCALQPAQAGCVWDVSSAVPPAPDGGWETAAASAPLPDGALAEALRYVADCMEQEARALYPPPDTPTPADADVDTAGADAPDSHEEASRLRSLGSYARASLLENGGMVCLLALLERCLRAEHAPPVLITQAAALLLRLVRACAEPSAEPAADPMASRVHGATAWLRAVVLRSPGADDDTQAILCRAIASATATDAPDKSAELLKFAYESLPALESSCAGAAETRRAGGAALLTGHLVAGLGKASSRDATPSSDQAGGTEPMDVDVTDLAEATSRLAALLSHRQARLLKLLTSSARAHE